jgi:hypothetical protein
MEEVITSPPQILDQCLSKGKAATMQDSQGGGSGIPHQAVPPTPEAWDLH